MKWTITLITLISNIDIQFTNKLYQRIDICYHLPTNKDITSIILIFYIDVQFTNEFYLQIDTRIIKFMFFAIRK